MKLYQFDEAPNNGHLIMQIALLRTAQSQLPAPDNSAAEEAKGAARMFERDIVLGRYATNIYLASLTLTQGQVAHCMDVQTEDILFSWLKDDVGERERSAPILFY